mmetsp:Transcript_41813/g.65409  ORF Transcript_41813/g.65409 Transcript_41813/m.65409 type:complete len:447 (-) Transcript_41813:200-1540(-)
MGCTASQDKSAGCKPVLDVPHQTARNREGSASLSSENTGGRQVLNAPAKGLGSLLSTALCEKFLETPYDFTAETPPQEIQGVSRSMALHFLLLSTAAYFGEELVRTWAPEQGYTGGAESIQNANHEAYLFEDNDNLVVAVRGTDDLADWAENLKLGFKKGDPCCESCHETHGRVHAGFKRHLDALWDQISSAVSSGPRQGKRLWVCGHSLGGAAATLAASRFTTLLGRPVAACFTFGAPRVGNQRWASLQSFRHYRVLNKNDVVPCVPPPILGYRHCGTEWYLSRSAQVLESLPAWRRNVDQAIQGLLRLGSAVGDHCPWEYARVLGALGAPATRPLLISCACEEQVEEEEEEEEENEVVARCACAGGRDDPKFRKRIQQKGDMRPYFLTLTTFMNPEQCCATSTEAPAADPQKNDDAVNQPPSDGTPAVTIVAAQQKRGQTAASK